MNLNSRSLPVIWLALSVSFSPFAFSSDPARWHFNYDLGFVDENGFSDIDGFSPPATSGSGTALLVGGVEPRFDGGDYAMGFNDGWHGDAHGGEGEEGNYGWQIAEFPPQGTGDGTAGAQFNVSTEGYANITISFAHRFSGRSSRHAALEYTLDGGFTWIRAYEYEAVNGHDLWYFQRYDLSHVPEANNNPDFGFRVVAIFMPGADPAGYEDANNNRPGVIFNNGGYRPSGTWRFDMVGVYADHPSVRINEFMGRNHVFLADADGDYESWLELYNAGNQPVNLNGYGLSDDYDNHFRWVIPDVTIPPGEFLVIFCSNKDRTSGELHTNFSISAGGEELFITHPDGWRVDEIPPYELGTNISLGRQPDGSPHLKYFQQATPGASNTTDGVDHGPIDPPTFSHTPGFYTEGFLLTLETDDPDATIYYTLDGSMPTTSSNVYTGPIEIDTREGDPDVYALIPTNFVASGIHAWQPPAEPVFKLTPVRARAYRLNSLPSSIITQSYLVDPDIHNRYSVNVVSINTSPENLFDDEIGIYVPGNMHEPGDNSTGNYAQRGIEWERPVHIELFQQDGALGFAQDAGARIHGGVTRRWPQKTLRLYARNAYGNQYFKYQLFPDQEDTEFRRYLLRNSGNDWRNTAFRDAMMQTLVRNEGFDTQSYHSTVVFINGEFWGIHHIRERYDKYYLERVHGADPDNIDLLTANAVPEEGDAVHYNAMISYIVNNDMSLDKHYGVVKSMMDVENFIAYYAAQIYIANTDWPANNIDFWRPRTPEGRWQWLMYDIDFGFGFAQNSNHNSLARVVETIQNWSTFLFRSLLENQAFRHDFINRYADMMNTSFKPSRVIDVIDEFAVMLSPIMPEVVLRWVNFGTVTNWQNRVQQLRNFANARPAHARQHVVEVFELPGQAELTFDNPTPDRGTIRINTVDPADYGGVPWTGVYFQSVPLPLYATPNEGYRFAGWEGVPSSNGQETFHYVPIADAALTAQFVNIADLNGDGVVDGIDLLTMLSNWGMCADPENCIGDINGDGNVDGVDLLILLSNWS